MKSAKRIAKIFLAVAMIAIAVVALAVTAFAEDTSGYAVKVEHADGTVTMYAPDADTSLSDAVRAGEAFEAAIKAAVEGDTIIALTDFDLPLTDNDNKDNELKVNATIDLNGKTVTTTGRIFLSAGKSLTVRNGTVDITSKELVYIGEWGSTASSTYVTFKDIVAKNAEEAADKPLFEIRAGSALLDNVTVNEGEWIFAKSTSANALISAGYKTRQKSQPINIEIRNSNIHVQGCSIINATGASGQATNMGGYTINLTVDGGSLNTVHNIIRMAPQSDKAADCALNMHVTGNAEIRSNTPVDIASTLSAEKVTIRMDYGVTTKMPKPAVGTVILGDDGNGVLDLIDYSDSSNTGVIRDLWVEDHTPVTDSAYTFVVVGDTQNTVNYDAENLHYIYDWILDNKDTKNIQFVFGMGDITNHSLDSEWPVAHEQITRLDGIVPYSLVRGNHDTSATYNATFNNDAYKSMFDGFFGDTIENSYVTFEVGEVKYLHLTLDYRASDAVLCWAGGIIAAHPEHRVIISTHAYLRRDGTLLTEGESTNGTSNSGQQMWNKLVSQYENIFLVLSGHVFATDLGYSQMEGVHGNTVTQIMTNGQCHDFKNGAMGLVSILHFSEDGKSISVEYYSTVHNKYFGKSSQFTLEVPEYAPATPEEPDYLYSITDVNGNVTTFDASTPLSTVLTSSALTNGSIVKFFGDVSVDEKIDLTKSVSIDLGGHTLSTDGGRINSGNVTINLMNGKVRIEATELFFVSETYYSAVINVSNVSVSHADNTNAFIDTRGGSVTLDGITVSADDWNVQGNLISAGYRTKNAGQAINITVKNSSIDLGAGSKYFISFSSAGTSHSLNGWTANVKIINSSITSANALVFVNPNISSVAEKCAVNVTVDGRSSVSSGMLFNISDLIDRDKITIGFEIGARMNVLPSVSGVTVDYNGGAPVADSTSGLFVIGEITEGCKLVDKDGNVVLLWDGREFTQELLDYAQSHSCVIVLLTDMTTPAGTDSSDRYNLLATVKDVTIDLNGHTLYMSSWAYFGTESSSKMITVKNGTIEHAYTAFYSYSGSESCGFTAEGVKFISTGTFSTFDHRIGILRLTNCEISFTNTTYEKEWNVFIFGNTNRTSPVILYMNGCTVTAGAPLQNIFKTYAGQPTTITVENSVLSTTSGGFIYYAANSKGKNPADSASFKNTTLRKDGNGQLFDIRYATVSITLDEVYVPSGSDYVPANGTVSIANGQTKATLADGGYRITVPKISVQSNLVLYTDFTLNIWLPTDTAATAVTVNGTEYSVKDAEITNGKYRIPIESIGADVAADDIIIRITYVDGEETLTVERAYSVVEYAKAIIEGETYSNEAKSLLVKVVSYVNSVYAYAGKAIPTELSELLAGDAYANAMNLETTDPVSAVPETETDIGEAGKAISGARLSLGSSVSVMFVLNPEYTGDLTIRYAGCVYECEVTNGTVEGKDYVLVDMRAFLLYEQVITITAGESVGNYDLCAYVHGIAASDATNENLAALLLELYNYCKEANEYRDYVDAPGGELN